MIPAGFLVLGLGWVAGDVPAPVIPPAATFAAAGSDAAQDLVVLGETRPIFLRMRVLTGDRAFRADWLDAARAALAGWDANKDGKVTIEEAEANGLGLLAGPAATTGSGKGRADIDRNKDGAIAPDELTEALGGPAGAFRVGADGGSGRRTDALFDHLDRDKDGAITRPELAATVGSLRQLDRDADEWISGYEVTGAAESPNGMGMPMAMGRGLSREAGQPSVLSLAADESPLRLIRALIKRYDTGSPRPPGRPDSKLSAAEFAIAAPAFTQADANHDGLLTSDELRKYLATNPTEAVLDIVLPTDPNGAALAVVRELDGGPVAGFAVRQLAPDQIEVEVGATRIDIQVDTGAGAIAGARATLQAQFRVADTSEDGYIDETELTDDNGQPAPLSNLFRPLDRDHDAELRPDEVEAGVTRQATHTRSKLTLNATDEGRAVFGLLDLDGNRQLGAREVLDASTRVIGCDRDHDGRTVPEEIPHQIHLTLTRGDLAPLFATANANPNVVVQRINVVAAPGVTQPTAGPVWFRKMDRNRDGDVSRREFLGTHPQFDRLDQDHDGLLGPAEADAATAKKPN